MDRIDRKILACLQQDAALSVAQVAERVGLSTTPCWRRIQKLEKDGVIRARVALLDAAKLTRAATVRGSTLKPAPPGWPSKRNSTDHLPRFHRFRR